MRPLTFQILRLLSDGAFHSGEEMARHLDISRASVWQGLRPLADAGVEIFRVPGRGYRLRAPLCWLDKSAIEAALEAPAAHLSLEVLDAVDSTNRLLLQKAALGAPHGSCIAAEMQTAGRGRRGRVWRSGLGGSLTFSLLWRFEQGAGFLSGLSLAIGVGLLRAMREAGITDAALKWPNDVLHHYRKLAGILIELQGDVSGPCAAVIGIGLNLKLSPDTLAQIDQAAVDFFSICGEAPDRNQLLSRLLSHLADVLTVFEQQGFAALRAEWLAGHAYQGKPVCLALPDGSQITGTLVDVAEDGALLLETALGRQRFVSGEISLRGVAA